MALVNELRGGSPSNPIVSRKTYNISDAELDKRITLFIHNWAEPMPQGLTTRQQAEWKLRQAHQKMIDYFKSEIERNGIIVGQPEVDVVLERIRQESTLPIPTEE